MERDWLVCPRCHRTAWRNPAGTAIARDETAVLVELAEDLSRAAAGPWSCSVCGLRVPSTSPVENAIETAVANEAKRLL